MRKACDTWPLARTPSSSHRATAGGADASGGPDEDTEPGRGGASTASGGPGLPVPWKVSPRAVRAGPGRLAHLPPTSASEQRRKPSQRSSPRGWPGDSHPRRRRGRTGGARPRPQPRLGTKSRAPQPAGTFHFPHRYAVSRGHGQDPSGAIAGCPLQGRNHRPPRGSTSLSAGSPKEPPAAHALSIPACTLLYTRGN